MADSVELTRAVVTQASPLRVRVAGAAKDSTSKRIASYSPTLGDVVAVDVHYMNTILTLGKEAS